MSTPVFATDIRDLAEAFKTLCEADELTNISTHDTRINIRLALDETIKKYRDQLKDDK